MSALPVTPYQAERIDPDGTPFPLHVLPDGVAEWARVTADSFPAPLEFVAAPILAVAGAAIGTTRTLRIKAGHDQLPLLFMMVIGRPGSAKSPALRAVTRPAWLEQRMHHEAWQSDRERALELERPEPPHPPQRVGVDFTTEALFEALARDDRGILYHLDEASAWVRSMDAYRAGKGADLQRWLSIWPSESTSIKRKAKPPTYVARPFATVLGGAQPAVLGDLTSGREDGFVDRILWVFPEPEPFRSSRTEVSPHLTRAYHNAIAALYRLEPTTDGDPLPVPPAHDARCLYYDWQDEQHYPEMNADGFPGHLLGPWRKLEAYTLRFALILQLLHDPDATQVGIDAMRGALELTDYFKNQAQKIHQVYHPDPDKQRAEAVLAWIHRKKLRHCTPSDLARAGVAGVRKVDDARALLEILEAAGHGTLTEHTYSNGRTGDRFEVTR